MFPPSSAVMRGARCSGVTGLGFSIIEVLIVIAIFSILVSLASPAYENYRNRQDYEAAKQDILTIQGLIERYYLLNNHFPESLEQVNAAAMRDPWGKAYYYLNIAGYDKQRHDADASDADAKMRRDKKLKPVNSDYDLYSSGKDHSTRAAFSAEVSRDDIVRCNNGGYIGLAGEY